MVHDGPGGLDFIFGRGAEDRSIARAPLQAAKQCGSHGIVDGTSGHLADLERERDCDDGIQALYLLYVLRMKARTLHIFCFSLLLGLLWIPMLQERTGLFQEKALAGVEDKTDSLPLTQATWFSKKFQENYVARHYKWMGLRPSMVRLHNQLDFSLFREPYRSVMVGLDNELFGRGSMATIQGKDFAGWEKIQYNCRNTAFLQNHFAARGVQMLTVLTPSKLQCMPEYLPHENLQFPDTSNYPAYVRELQKANVHLLDLTTPLINWVATEPYRIFPRTGTHWTDYGAVLGAYAIIREMERLSGRAYFHPKINAIQKSLEMQGTDADAGDLLNLIWDIPPAEIGYPTLKFDSAGRVRPRVLVIGDSFWWKIYNQGIHREVFAPGSQYRYYNYEVFSDQWNGAKYINDFDLRQVVEHVDFVVLCVNADNLHRYPFEFVDQVLGQYYR